MTRMVERSHFGRDENASVAPIFGLSLFAMLMAVGLAVDGSRAYNVSLRVGAALDTAALAGAKLLDQEGASDAEVSTVAQAYFNAHAENVKVPGTSFRNLTVTTNRSDNSVKVAVAVEMPTTFGQVANISSIEFSKESTVVFSSKRIELAMVLDVTGSMNNSGKLDAMKSAARDIIDTLIEPSSGRPSNNKIGLAPYSAAVNAGGYYGAVAAGPNALGDTCVIERQGAASQEDRAPSAGAKVDVMTTPPDAGNPDYHYSCPDADVLAMTSDRDALRSRIDSFAASGWTAGHIGAAWGWHIVSPNWGGVWGSTPAPYSDRQVVKAVLIMTDGVFNTAYKSGHTQSWDAQVAQAYAEFGEICTGMKAQGIKVFTVAFALSSEPEPDRSRGLDALSQCATSPAHFFDAETNDQLRAAFQSIADQLSSMRIKS